MGYPNLATSALVINEKSVSSGRVPSSAEGGKFLTAALAEQAYAMQDYIGNEVSG